MTPTWPSWPPSPDEPRAATHDGDRREISTHERRLIMGETTGFLEAEPLAAERDGDQTMTREETS